MRKVTAHLFSSADGVVESPNLFQFDRFGPEEGEAMGKALAPVTDVILGRTIYDEWSGYFAGNDEDFGAFINPVAKHVASRTLQDPLEWNNSTVIGAGRATSPYSTGGRTQRDPYDCTQPFRVAANPSRSSAKYCTMSLRSTSPCTSTSSPMSSCSRMTEAISSRRYSR